MRRFLPALAVAGVVSALIAGCSSVSSPSSPASTSKPVSSSAAAASSSTPTSSKSAEDPLPDPSALLKESSAATKVLSSAHLALSVAGKVAEMPVKALKGDLTNQPERAAKGSAKVGIMGSDVETQFVVLGGHLYVMLPGAAWVDYGPTANNYDVTAVLNPDDGLANMLANFIDPKVEARETVGEQHTIRVTGKVTADAVNKMVPQLDATKRMSSTVWIQESGAHQVVQANLEPSKDDAVQMIFSNWNAPVAVEKPPVPPPPPPAPPAGR